MVDQVGWDIAKCQEWDPVLIKPRRRLVSQRCEGGPSVGSTGGGGPGHRSDAVAQLGLNHMTGAWPMQYPVDGPLKATIGSTMLCPGGAAGCLGFQMLWALGDCKREYQRWNGGPHPQSDDSEIGSLVG